MGSFEIQTVERDRGLGTAYERFCFYQLMAKWAAEYGVESALEGPVDGMAGIRGVHCVGLAREGVSVVVAVANDATAEIAREVYADARPGGRPAGVQVRVVNPSRVADLPRADLVLVYHALPFVDDWRGYLRSVGALARKVLIVTTCNPDNWGAAALTLVGRERAPGVLEDGDSRASPLGDGTRA